MSMSYNNFCIKLLTCTHAGKSSIRCLRKIPKQERFEKTSLNDLGLNSLRNLQRFKLPYDKNGQLPIAAKGKDHEGTVEAQRKTSTLPKARESVGHQEAVGFDWLRG